MINEIPIAVWGQGGIIYFPPCTVSRSKSIAMNLPIFSEKIYLFDKLFKWFLPSMPFTFQIKFFCWSCPARFIFFKYSGGIFIHQSIKFFACAVRRILPYWKSKLFCQQNSLWCKSKTYFHLILLKNRDILEKNIIHSLNHNYCMISIESPFFITLMNIEFKTEDLRPNLCFLVLAGAICVSKFWTPCSSE